MFYVYAYYVTNSEIPFYIGKGSGSRCKIHLRKYYWNNPGKSVNPYFYGKIKEIFESGDKPIVKILKEFDDENDALDYEHCLILEYGTFNDDGPLLNISTSRGGPTSSDGVEYKPWSEERAKKFKKLCKEKRKYDPSFDELFCEYIKENMTRGEIAKKHNVSVHLVKKRLESYGIKKPKNKRYELRAINKFICEQCKKTFYTKTKNRKFCSRECLHERNRNAKRIK